MNQELEASPGQGNRQQGTDLEEEVRRWRRRQFQIDDHELLKTILPTVELTIEQVQEQIKDWETLSE